MTVTHRRGRAALGPAGRNPGRCPGEDAGVSMPELPPSYPALIESFGWVVEPGLIVLAVLTVLGLGGLPG